MVRIKKTIDYINVLCRSEMAERRLLGENLKRQYAKWVSTLDFDDFSAFADVIMRNRKLIGAAQLFGKFRAYALEEYLYRLLKKRCKIQQPLDVFWGEKCLVLRNDGKAYGIEFDVSVGAKNGAYVDPLLVIDAKMELDSARLKTSLGSFVIMKNYKPGVYCVIVYVVEELDAVLLRLAGNWVNAFFQLTLKNGNVENLVNYVNSCLEKAY
ncbi:hypothetical protein H5T51_02245 [Candidatus Bathyarchaeota archaeon]|nr:hypothetical protein [Candidatus Bathyarchaeota archaeon]